MSNTDATSKLVTAMMKRLPQEEANTADVFDAKMVAEQEGIAGADLHNAVTLYKRERKLGGWTRVGL
jgi:hypothetical protein